MRGMKVLAVAWLVGSMAATARPAQEPPADPINAAIKQVNRGDVAGGVAALRAHLKRDAKDVDAHLVLGRVLDFDGRPEEAVEAWESGVVGGPRDFELLMEVGMLRLRQGDEGPNVTTRRGTVEYRPSKDEKADEAFKREHVAMAIAAFEKAHTLRPDEPAIASALADALRSQGENERAAGIWQELVERRPKDADARLGLALALFGLGRNDEAAAQLTEAIAIDPRRAEAHVALAKYHDAVGHKDEAEASRARAAFYDALPPFATLDFSDESAKALASMGDIEAVRALADDPSDRASELLAILCWRHPHDETEAIAFRSLEERGAATTPLLRALLEESQSTCTIKSTSHILARRKEAGLYERLVAMLPGDTRSFGMDMDVAGALDDLGDDRAVGPLVEVLAPGDETAEGMSPMSDRQGARVRATLALGAFDTPEARRALERASRNRTLVPFALAALYRQTKDAARLAALDKAVGPDDAYESLVLGDYLETKIGTDEAKALARKWADRRAAQEAKEEAVKASKPDVRKPKSDG